jgi:hypothetical protein
MESMGLDQNVKTAQKSTIKKIRIEQESTVRSIERQIEKKP